MNFAFPSAGASFPVPPFEWRETLRALQPLASAKNPHAFIGGGALRDLLLGREPKDVDLFLSRDWLGLHALPDDVLEAWTLRSRGAPPEVDPDSWSASDDTICELYDFTHKSGTKYQAIIRLDQLGPAAMIRRFDFGVCQVAWDTVHGWTFTDAFVNDLQNKTFTVTPGALYPQATLKRAELFKERFPDFTFDLTRAEEAMDRKRGPGGTYLDNRFE
jgi:hypothetical protein